MSDEYCDWTFDADDNYGDSWDGACGAKWIFLADGPIENKMRFCPECGKRTRTVIATEDAASNESSGSLRSAAK